MSFGCFGFDSLPPGAIPPPPAFITGVANTNSVALTVLAGILTADLIVDPNPANDIVVSGTGVFVEKYTNGTYLSLVGHQFDIDFSTFSTTQITEGLNLYYTNARVLAAPLTGFVPDNTPIAATDSVLVGFNRAQGQLNNKLDLSGGVMTGFLTLNADPVNALHAASKNYVDNFVNGLSWKLSAKGSTVSPLAAYTVSGGGTILTATANGAFPVTDGVIYLLNDRILVKNEAGANEPNNGGYYISDLGSAGTPWVLTRTTDANTSDKLLAATWRVRQGTIEANKVYAINVSPIVMGVTNITMAQIAGAGTYTNGTYLSLTGNVFDINFATFSTTQITEGLNLYFTTARARQSISAPVGPIVYNNVSGEISIPAATTLVDGYLTSVDWNTFNSKEPAITILPVAKGGTGINATVDTRIFFADGANTFAQNANLAFQKTTTAGTNGVLQLGGNAYIARPGLAMTMATSTTYIVGDLVGVGSASIHYGVPTTTNHALHFSSSATVVNAPTSGGLLLMRVVGTTIQSISNTTISWTPQTATSGSAVPFTFTSPTSTGQTAGTETVGVNFDLSNQITHASNTTVALNRDMYVQARTHAFATAGGVITDAATLYITGAPIAGTNATITNAMAMWIPSGNVNLGNASRTNQRLVRIGQGAHFIDLGNATNDNSAAIYLDQSTPSTSNYAIAGEQGTGSTYINATNSVRIRANGVATDLINASATQVALTVQTLTTGSATPFVFTTPAHTGQTAGTETVGFNLNMSATITHASNTTIATNRDLYVQARTHAFATAGGVITDAATLYITGAPIAGTNATITNAMAMWVPSGNVNIGNAARTSQRLIRFGQDSAFVDIGSNPGSTSLVGIYFSATPSTTNYSLGGSSFGLILNATNNIQLRTNHTDVQGTFAAGNLAFTPTAIGGGNATPITFITAANTAQTASAETIGFDLNMSATIQHTVGALTTNRDFLVRARTHSFTSLSTITNAATLAITAAPIAGANATITNAYALWIQGGISRFDGDISINDAINVVLGTATGTKFATAAAQKMGFWNAAPIVQPTNAVAASVFVANTSGIVDDTATFDGYTLGQVVKALRNMGLLT